MKVFLLVELKVGKKDDLKALMRVDGMDLKSEE